MRSNRIAVTDIDFDKINMPHIFKIFESIVGNRIQSVGLYQDGGSECKYAIAIFKDSESAYQVYEICDGVEVGQSGLFLNLSFVPDDMELDEPEEFCENSKNFVFNNEMNKKVIFNEDMIELSDDNACYFEIPEEIKLKIKEEESQKEKKEPEIKNKVAATETRSMLEQEEKTSEFEDFQFNLKDDRFSELFKNNDFILDASNKKFKNQKVSNLIHNESLKNDEK